MQPIFNAVEWFFLLMYLRNGVFLHPTKGDLACRSQCSGLALLQGSVTYSVEQCARDLWCAAASCLPEVPRQRACSAALHLVHLKARPPEHPRALSSPSLSMLQIADERTMEHENVGDVFSGGLRPSAAATGDVCLALDYLEDPAAHGVTCPEGVMEPAVFLCDIASLPGADAAFAEAQALPRLKELLWLLAPYAELQIIVAECLLCTLHRLVDAHSQYRSAAAHPSAWNGAALPLAGGARQQPLDGWRATVNCRAVGLCPTAVRFLWPLRIRTYHLARAITAGAERRPSRLAL